MMSSVFPRHMSTCLLFIFVVLCLHIKSTYLSNNHLLQSQRRYFNVDPKLLLFHDFKPGYYNKIPLPRKHTSKVGDRFYTTKIVPELIPEAPKEYLKVDFPSGEPVCLGNHFNVYDTLLEPKFYWKNYQKGKLYTIMMIDMDALDRKHWYSPFVNLLVVNVKGPSQKYSSSTNSLLPQTKDVRHVVTTITRQQLWNIDNMAEFVAKNQKNFKPKIVKFDPKMVPKYPKYTKEVSAKAVKVVKNVPAPKVLTKNPKIGTKVPKAKSALKPGEVKLTIKLPPKLAPISDLIETAPLGQVNIKNKKVSRRRWTPKLLFRKRILKRSVSVQTVPKNHPKKFKEQQKSIKTIKSNPVVPPVKSTVKIVKPVRDPHPIISLNIRERPPGELRGDYVLRYHQPMSTPSSEFHRIVLLVFEQPKKISKVLTTPFDFNVKNFIKQHKLGAPVAGNFFYSKLYVTRKVYC